MAPLDDDPAPADPQVGSAVPHGGCGEDDSYRREDNEAHRRERPLGYAPVRRKRRA